ncbi:hypothetical protein M0812_22292 [Anaeramoeba flamelloides]|uniref:Uncharacterized protein n=1 Tax=Anaeramoeba flamelloides TaxID=1746091 RepID=A0AAV7YU67_9EUKA|nr:hypothetical protein M0812_22292 [Anaeramoeba flamelloides]
MLNEKNLVTDLLQTDYEISINNKNSLINKNIRIDKTEKDESKNEKEKENNEKKKEGNQNGLENNQDTVCDKVENEKKYKNEKVIPNTKKIDILQFTKCGTKELYPSKTKNNNSVQKKEINILSVKEDQKKIVVKMEGGNKEEAKGNERKNENGKENNERKRKIEEDDQDEKDEKIKTEKQELKKKKITAKN